MVNSKTVDGYGDMRLSKFMQMEKSKHQRGRVNQYSTAFHRGYPFLIYVHRSLYACNSALCLISLEFRSRKIRAAHLAQSFEYFRYKSTINIQ